MPQQPSDAEQIRATLHELAGLLREARHLDPEVQRAVADLVDELGKAFDPAAMPSTVTALLDSVTHLAQVLHKPHDRNLLEAARDRLERAAVKAEAEAPLASGVVRRLLDTIANLGI